MKHRSPAFVVALQLLPLKVQDCRSFYFRAILLVSLPNLPPSGSAVSVPRPSALPLVQGTSLLHVSVPEFASTPDSVFASINCEGEGCRVGDAGIRCVFTFNL